MVSGNYMYIHYNPKLATLRFDGMPAQVNPMRSPYSRVLILLKQEQ